jgi:hypothetical protein
LCVTIGQIEQVVLLISQLPQRRHQRLRRTALGVILMAWLHP